MNLISLAFDLLPPQIISPPTWAKKDKFDIAGEPDQPGQPNPEQMRLMFQKLLEDRFKLATHIEKRELSVSALQALKDTPRFDVSDANPRDPPSIYWKDLPDGAVLVQMQNVTMQNLARFLYSSISDRQIIDQTGLPGHFDLSITFTPANAIKRVIAEGPLPEASTPGPPDLAHAIQEQLGLKLEPTKAPVEVLVIDHVEKPSEN